MTAAHYQPAITLDGVPAIPPARTPSGRARAHLADLVEHEGADPDELAREAGVPAATVGRLLAGGSVRDAEAARLVRCTGCGVLATPMGAALLPPEPAVAYVARIGDDAAASRLGVSEASLRQYVSRWRSGVPVRAATVDRLMRASAAASAYGPDWERGDPALMQADRGPRRRPPTHTAATRPRRPDPAREPASAPGDGPVQLALC